MSTVRFPNSCNETAIFRFCTEVVEQAGAEELLIDFSSMGRIEPFSMAYVAKNIRDFYRNNKNTSIRCVGYENKEYAANMAFFRAFGLKHGREPNCKDGNESFVPFTILRIQTIVDEASKEWKEAQDIIEKRSEHLSRILSREEKGNLVDALIFSIREIMRNVLEHSQSRSMEYCAQFWSTYNKVEIAIIDNGIGLRKSLSANPFIQIQSDSDAIQQALMPAISSKNFKGAIIDRNNPWHNSGFGLYMISRICRLGGSFLICSGDHGVALNEHGKQHIELGHQLNGTAVRMVLNTSKLTELSQMLAKFRDDGYEIAKEIKGVGMYTASAASQMLSRDFKKQA